MDGKIDLIFKIGTYFFLSSEHPGNEKKRTLFQYFGMFCSKACEVHPLSPYSYAVQKMSYNKPLINFVCLVITGKYQTSVRTVKTSRLK